MSDPTPTAECAAWRENEGVGTYVSAKHDKELHSGIAALRAENAKLRAERDVLREFAAWVEFHASHATRKYIVEQASRTLGPISGSVRTIGRVPGRDAGMDVWVPDSPKEASP